ncbi:MAG: AAA family ATPase [Alphaproteobacteria bacterium]
MSKKYTSKSFSILEKEYQKLTAETDKSSEWFNKIDELEKEILPCARYLAEKEKHPEAMYWLCEQRAHGSCQTEITSQEFELYLNQASDKGHTAAMRLLGRYYYGWERVLSVRQIRKNRAFELFEKAAGEGDRQARCDLARAFCESRDESKIARADNILRDLMEEGIIPAFYVYYFNFFWIEDGLYHGDEQGGFDVLNRAVSSLEKLSIHSDSFYESLIYYYIALCYYEGAGCSRDTARAVDFMQRSVQCDKYGDAYFWLKNKGIVPVVDKADTMPDIFRKTDVSSESNEDWEPDDDDFQMELDAPLSFIDIEKGKKQEQEQKKKEEEKRKKEAEKPVLTKSDLERVLKPFEDMIGLEGIKEQITGLFYTVMADDLRRRKGVTHSHKPMLHMVFTGNPGTGKTTVARMLGQVFKDLGHLKRGHIVEVDRSKMVGAYIGHSEAITTELFKRAKGGVLFIDEAYDLEKGYSPNDFGEEVLAMLVKKMEDDRSDMIVIMAGYREEMSWMLDSNVGLRSRIGVVVDFPDYTDEEKQAIFEKYAGDYSFKLRKDAKDKLACIFKGMEPKKKDKFGNGRGVRSLFEQTLRAQARRVIEEDINHKTQLLTIIADDIPGEVLPSDKARLARHNLVSIK